MEQEKTSMAQQAKQVLLNGIKDPFGHLLGLSFYIVGMACGIWCVTIALGFAASILGIFWVFVRPRFSIGDLVQIALPVQLQLFSEFSDFSDNSIGVVKEIVKRKSEHDAFEYNYIVFIEGNSLMFFQYQ